MKTSFAEENAFVQRKGGMTCRQRKEKRIPLRSGGCCEHEFVTELCILRGCKNIGVRLLEEEQTSDRAEKRVANTPGGTQQERASLADS